jgi:hypothetical protein
MTAVGQVVQCGCGLVSTALVRVPPNRATSGTPYCASPPKLLTVFPGMVAPKFHAHPSGPLLPSDQYA